MNQQRSEMKWSCGSFLENRTFDQRLVKEDLVDKWNIHGDIYKARTDYRQFQDSYVIHQINISCAFKMGVGAGIIQGMQIISESYRFKVFRYSGRY